MKRESLLSQMTQKCIVCNTILFDVEPFRTTQQEIVEFARRSSLSDADKQAIIQAKWLHPGYYCPKGCRTILMEEPLSLPTMQVSESTAIATEYSRKHLKDFTETHGWNSRIVACVFCTKFGGAKLDGGTKNSLYRKPKLRPFSNTKIVSAICSDPRIQEIKFWWYTKSEAQAECEYFEYGTSFKWIYKDVTGWSEYPLT